MTFQYEPLELDIFTKGAVEPTGGTILYRNDNILLAKIECSTRFTVDGYGADYSEEHSQYFPTLMLRANDDDEKPTSVNLPTLLGWDVYSYKVSKDTAYLTFVTSFWDNIPVDLG